MSDSVEIPMPTSAYASAATIGLGLLLLGCAVFGFLARTRSKTFEAFLGRHPGIGPVVTGLALSAVWLSGWACLGAMGVMYTVGWSGMWFAGIWTMVGIVPCVLLTGLKMREYAARFGARTVPDAIGIRFDSKVAQSLAGLAMLGLMLLYAVGQYKAGATCWYAVTGLSPGWCLLLCAVLVSVYMVLGGYTVTQWTMALQGALLGIGCLTLGIAALVFVGGPGALNERLASEQAALVKLVRPDLPHVGKYQMFSDPVGIAATFLIFLTMAAGFPHNVARFMRTHDVRRTDDVRGMRRITARGYALMVGVVFLAAGPPVFLNVITGLSARAMFGSKLLAMPPWKGDLAAPYAAMAVGGVPLATLYIVGLFAAVFSTLSAMMMVMVGNITRDVVQVWRPQADPDKLLWLTRFLMIVFVLLPLYWTLRRPPELLAVFMGYAAIGLGGIFIFCTAVSFYWRRATKVGAIACILYGFFATLIGAWLVSQNRIGMGTLEYIVLVGCAVAYFVGSYISRPLPAEQLDRLFKPRQV